MGLKRRLAISNAAIVIVPILITAAASLLFLLISSKFLGSKIGYSDVKKLARTEYELLGHEGDEFRQNPEILMDKEYRLYYARELSEAGAHIIVVDDCRTVFASMQINDMDLRKCMDTSNGGIFGKTIDINGIFYIARSYPVVFKDGKDNSRVIILAPLGRNGTNAGSFAVFALSVFIVSIISAIALQAYAMSKRILRPLERLKAAAGEISGGNLEHAIIEDGDSEVRELCLSFEHMRLKLKESVHRQMEYDDNRKMLVSSISHDLKTPMASIKGYVEGIMDGVADTPEKMDKYLKTIRWKTARMDMMIDDLLLYSKLDLHQIPFNFERTDIYEYFKDSIDANEYEPENGNIGLNLQNELVQQTYVKMDRERFKRVIANILDNAKKYIDKREGRVIVILRETASNAVAEIADNGPGIPEGDLPYVFDRFYRADQARDTASGNGLGLAIARQIIEAHGGKIWARNRGSEGASIMISLKKVE